MDFNAFKEIVAARAQALGIAEYELYYEAGESTSVDAFRHELNKFSSSRVGGICFRCIVGGKMGYASTEALNAEQARAIVERAADNASVLESEEPVFLSEGGQSYETLDLVPYDLPETDELIHTVLDTQEKLYAADPAVVDGCQAQGLRQRVEFAIYNSKGLDLHYENNISCLVVSAVVSDGTEMTEDFQMKAGKLSEIDATQLTEKAVAGALCKLGGEVPPTAVCPVVFSPEAMSDLLAAFSPLFSSENTQKGLSRLGEKEGQIIASPAVTLVDDPFYQGSALPINFDAEGSPAHRKNVIENGELKTLLYNLKTAAVAGKKTTGNASKGRYDSPVAVSPFTMYLAPGKLSEDELLSKAGNGVYINSLSGLHAGANPVSGDFSLQSAGFMIADGKKTSPLKSFTVAGNFYDLLASVTAVADNLEVPRAISDTAFGSPSVLVEALSIAGK